MARTNPAGTKAPAKKATAAKKAPAKTVAEGRKPRGWLAAAVLKVCQDFTSGKVKLEDGKLLTPHRVAKIVQERDGSEEPPSTGAVSAVFKRWDEFGFATFNAKPFAFKKLTAKGEKEGLEGLILQRRETRKATHAKAKAAAAK